jgi:hypothetical protein
MKYKNKRYMNKIIKTLKPKNNDRKLSEEFEKPK